MGINLLIERAILKMEKSIPKIDFGHKKFHTAHLKQLYPDILSPTAKVTALISKVAPGRPCTHKPMREIVSEILRSIN